MGHTFTRNRSTGQTRGVFYDRAGTRNTICHRGWHCMVLISSLFIAALWTDMPAAWTSTWQQSCPDRHRVVCGLLSAKVIVCLLNCGKDKIKSSLFGSIKTNLFSLFRWIRTSSSWRNPTSVPCFVHAINERGGTKIISKKYWSIS